MKEVSEEDQVSWSVGEACRRRADEIGFERNCLEEVSDLILMNCEQFVMKRRKVMKKLFLLQGKK